MEIFDSMDVFCNLLSTIWTSERNNVLHGHALRRYNLQSNTRPYTGAFMHQGGNPYFGLNVYIAQQVTFLMLNIGYKYQPYAYSNHGSSFSLRIYWCAS